MVHLWRPRCLVYWDCYGLRHPGVLVAFEALFRFVRAFTGPYCYYLAESRPSLCCWPLHDCLDEPRLCLEWLYLQFFFPSRCYKASCSNRHLFHISIAVISTLTCKSILPNLRTSRSHSYPKHDHGRILETCLRRVWHPHDALKWMPSII